MVATQVRPTRDCYALETPSETGTKLTAIPAGTDLFVIDNSHPDYVQVIHENRPVYVHRADLRPVDDASTRPRTGDIRQSDSSSRDYRRIIRRAAAYDAPNIASAIIFNLEQGQVVEVLSDGPGPYVRAIHLGQPVYIAREYTVPASAEEMEMGEAHVPLAAPPTRQAYAQGSPCPQCGTPPNLGARFCRSCGAGLTSRPALRDLADFWIRFGALVIDGIITTVASFVVSAVLGSADPSTLLYWLPTILSSAYYLVGYSLGATAGALVCGLRIVTEDGDEPGFGRGTIRLLVSFVSAVPLGLGYFWAIWDDKKQTWHDKAAGTIVVMRR